MALKRRVEEVSLNSWPAVQQILYDGWIVRFSGGYTKRANSVNPLYASTLDIEDKIDTSERLYAEKGLPTIFRLNDWSIPVGLDEALDKRGYKRHAPTTVMVLNLEEASLAMPLHGLLHEVSLDEWLGHFSAFSNALLQSHHLHRNILEAIPARCSWATLVDSQRVVACALGVLDGGFFGLFDLVTEATRRRRGYGTSLVNAQLRWAREQRAQYAYLQVVDANTPARGLYKGLGFAPLYGYWYRVGR